MRTCNELDVDDISGSKGLLEHAQRVQQCQRSSLLSDASLDLDLSGPITLQHIKSFLLVCRAVELEGGHPNTDVQESLDFIYNLAERTI